MMAAVAPPLWGILYLIRRGSPACVWRVLRWTAAVYTALLTIYSTHLLITYAAAPNYIRYEEPFVHCLALLYARGDVLYPSLGAAVRYGGPYGPMLYIVNSWFLTLFGSNQHVLKAVNGLALIGSGIALFAAARKYTSAGVAGAAGAVQLAFVLEAGDFCVSARADGLIVFLASLALWAVQQRKTVLIGALAAAVAINIKVHAFLYFAPLLAFAAAVYGYSTAIYAVSVAAAAVAVPFLLPNVSLTNYVSWLRVTASLPLMTSVFAQNLIVTAYLLVPVVCLVAMRARLSVRPRRSMQVTVLCVVLVGAVLTANDVPPSHFFVYLMAIELAACVMLFLSFVGDGPASSLEVAWLCNALGPAAVIVALIASKPGAGYWHMLPFAPIALWLAASIAEAPLNGKRRL